MAEFDSIAKHLIQTYPADFVRFALAQDDVKVLGVLNAEQLTPTTHQMDSLIRVQIDGQEVLVHHEFQTTDSNPPMPIRMAGYIGRGIQQHRLPIYSTVIYLRPNAGRTDPGCYIQQRHGFQILVQYQVIRLSEIDGQAVLDGGYTGLLPFAPLMKPPAGEDAEAWLRRCVQKVETLPVDAATKVHFLTNLTIVGGLTYDYPTIQRIIPEDIMYESSVIQHFAERGVKQGIEQGIEQGREGMLREAIQEVLELRIGVEQTRPLVDRIAAVDGVEPLRHLLRAAVQAADGAAFRAALDRTTFAVNKSASKEG